MAWDFTALIFLVTVTSALQLDVLQPKALSEAHREGFKGRILARGSVLFNTLLFGKVEVLTDCSDYTQIPEAAFLLTNDCDLSKMTDLTGTKAVFVSEEQREIGLEDFPFPIIAISADMIEELLCADSPVVVSVNFDLVAKEQPELLFVLSLDSVLDTVFSGLLPTFESYSKRGRASLQFEIFSRSASDERFCSDGGRFCSSKGERGLMEVVRQHCVRKLRSTAGLLAYQLTWLAECSVQTVCVPALQRVVLSETEVGECVTEDWVSARQAVALEQAKQDFEGTEAAAPAVLLGKKQYQGSWDCDSIAAFVSSEVPDALDGEESGAEDWQKKAGNGEDRKPDFVFKRDINLKDRRNTARNLPSSSTTSSSSSTSSNAWSIWIIIASIVFVTAFVCACVFFLIAWRIRRNRRVQQVRATHEVQQTMEMQALEALGKLEVRAFTSGFVEFGLPTCVICLSEYPPYSFKLEESVVKTLCRHLFHTDCLKAWFKSHIDCPICKRNPMELQADAFTDQTNAANPLSTQRSSQGVNSMQVNYLH